MLAQTKTQGGRQARAETFRSPLLFLIPIYEMKAVVVCIPLFLMLTFRRDASPAAGTDNQVKLLMRRYEQVEDQLARSVHLRQKNGI